MKRLKGNHTNIIILHATDDYSYFTNEKYCDLLLCVMYCELPC